MKNVHRGGREVHMDLHLILATLSYSQAFCTELMVAAMGGTGSPNH